MSDGLKFIAFDLGASSGRSLLGTLNNGKLDLAETHRFVNEGICANGTYYWDALRLFDEMKTGLRLAVQNHGKDIIGAGLDTWGVDFGLLGPNDVLLGNPVCYRDARTDGMLAEAMKIIPKAEMYEQTGIQFMQLNTVYQLLALTRQNPWMLDIAKTLLLIPDLFNFWFTGEKVCEFTEATTSQMYNPRTGDWARPMMERLGIPTHFLTKVVQPGTVLGKIRASIMEETGAGEITFVAPACHDTGSAVAAVPATDKEFVYISSGTWSLMGIESREPIINETTRELNFTNEGGVAGTFRFLHNIMGLWLVQECRRTWAQSGKEFSFAELAQLAAASEPFRSIVDPDDDLFLKPGDMPARIREFCTRTGQPVPENEGQTVRAALDGLALKYRWVLEKLESLTGRRLEKIHMVGGGIQNKLLCRLTANVTGRTVIAGPVEATATGNILVQAMALGHIGSMEELRQVVRNSFDLVTYEPEADPRIDDAYGRFLGLIS